MADQKNETKAVEPQFTSEGLPIWKTEEGIVEGYKREHFLQNIPKDNDVLRKKANSEFFTYKSELTGLTIAKYEAIIEKKKVLKENFLKKAQDVLHEPSPEELKKRELERIENRAAKLREELGLMD